MPARHWIILSAGLALQAVALAAPLEGITFAADPGMIFVPVEEAAKELRWPVQRDDMGKVYQLNEIALRAGSLRSLTDGTELASTELLAEAGASVSAPDPEGRISLSGWQGERLVLDTRISSGRRGSTPGGEFIAGPFRSRMHHSSRYQNAPMPWSVQINGHIFVHGFSSVPRYPASHGCIRLPLDEGNPARFFYEWVQNGTPVRVTK